MACFKTVSDKLQLSDQWTADNEFAWLQSLLTISELWNPGSDAANPFTATILHLESAGINPNTLRRVRQLLASHETKFAAGARP